MNDPLSLTARDLINALQKFELTSMLKMRARAFADKAETRLELMGVDAGVDVDHRSNQRLDINISGNGRLDGTIIEEEMYQLLVEEKSS